MSDANKNKKKEGLSVRSSAAEYLTYIASPVYFSELTGKTLDVGSRLQTYFCASAFRKEKPIPKVKKGAVILVGGGDGNMEKAFGTACTLLHHMNCRDIHELVSSHNTNSVPAIWDEKTVQGVMDISSFFNDGNAMA